MREDCSTSACDLQILHVASYMQCDIDSKSMPDSKSLHGKLNILAIRSFSLMPTMTYLLMQ